MLRPVEETQSCELHEEFLEWKRQLHLWDLDHYPCLWKEREEEEEYQAYLSEQHEEDKRFYGDLRAEHERARDIKRAQEEYDLRLRGESPSSAHYIAPIPPNFYFEFRSNESSSHHMGGPPGGTGS